jgi:hypothetical protein
MPNRTCIFYNGTQYTDLSPKNKTNAYLATVQIMFMGVLVPDSSSCVFFVIATLIAGVIYIKKSRV